MAIAEVFPNPTVKNVIFQIRFPNLFFLESKIGEFQLAVMEKFPESALAFRKQFVIADLGPKAGLENLPEPEASAKIWQFRSKNHVELNLMTNSLDISSESHKTYNHADSPYRFRDTISFAVDRFLAIVKIPLITRIGLRYIDECPVPARTNDAFIAYYNTAFPLTRFPVSDSSEMDFKAVVRKGTHKLRYAESLKSVNGQDKLILDFDGFSEDVKAEAYLQTTDDLHDLIVAEYQQTIKEPVYQYMRTVKGM